MKEEEKRELAEKAFEEINNACRLVEKHFLNLPPDIQNLLIECYKLGYIAAIEKMKGSD